MPRAGSSARRRTSTFPSPRRGRVGRAGPADWWRAAGRPSAGRWPLPASRRRASRRSAFPARCTAPCCSTRRTRSSGRRCSGAISGPRRECNATHRRRSAPARLIELTCNPALTGFTLPKLLWVREHEPRDLARASVGAAAEGLRPIPPDRRSRDRCRGRVGHAAASTSRTPLVERDARDATDIDAALLPRAYESPEVTGAVSAAGAAATGLRAGTPVVAGGGDQAAGAVGMGIVAAGAVSATIGTSGVVFAATDRAGARSGRPRPHLLPRRAWHAGTSWASPRAPGSRCAGCATVWRGCRRGRDPYDRLTRGSGRGAARLATACCWAPYLMGERTPHLDPHARAALVGLTASHTRGHIVRAILEGVAFSLQDRFTIFARDGASR